VRIYSDANLVGTSSNSLDNIISGNLMGIEIRPGADNNTIRGNFIGTDRTGSVAVGNNVGIVVSGAIGTRILDNVISGNTTDGIQVNQNTLATEMAFNHIGTAPDGSEGLGTGGAGIVVGPLATGNLIISNIISGNVGLGIDLLPTDGTRGVTPNDALDA